MGQLDENNMACGRGTATSYEPLADVKTTIDGTWEADQPVGICILIKTLTDSLIVGEFKNGKMFGK